MMGCLVAQLCPTLCNPMDNYSPWDFPGKNIWSGLPFPSPGDLPNPGIKLSSPALAGRCITTEPPGKPCMTRALVHFSVSRVTHMVDSANHRLLIQSANKCVFARHMVGPV